MLARAPVICVLVSLAALAATRVGGAGNPELKAQLAKLDQEEAKLNEQFKKAINENYESIQRELDRHIAHNFSKGKHETLVSANTFKQVSVLFAEFETKRYAAARRALDISRDFLEAELGKKLITSEGEVTVDSDLFDLVKTRVKAACLNDVYSASVFLWRYLSMWTNFNLNRAFGERTSALFSHMEQVKVEENISVQDKYEESLEKYCTKNGLKLRSPLMAKLNELVKELMAADKYSIRSKKPTKFGDVDETVGSLVKRYVGEKLLGSIKKDEAQCIQNRKGWFNYRVATPKVTEKSDSYYFIQP